MKKEMFLFSWRARVLLVLPTLLIVTELWFYNSQAFMLSRTLLALAVALLSLPYILFFIIVALVPGTEQLDSKRLRYGVLTIAICVGLLGLSVGRNHHLFLTCEQFQVAGNHVPDNCTPAASL